MIPTTMTMRVPSSWSLARKASLFSPRNIVPPSPYHHSTTLFRLAHTVRVILTSDVPDRSMFEHDVVDVKAGYARNYLIPLKKALYATPENFKRLGLTDPLVESEEEKRARLLKERQLEDEEGAEEVKAANLLRHYLRNKVLTIWRHVDKSTNTVHPGMVDAKAVRQKLGVQLKIDLDDTEQVHLREEPIVVLDASEEEALLDDMDTSSPCTTQVRQLGDYLAKISLAGGHSVPLKVTVARR